MNLLSRSKSFEFIINQPINVCFEILAINFCHKKKIFDQCALEDDQETSNYNFYFSQRVGKEEHIHIVATLEQESENSSLIHGYVIIDGLITIVATIIGAIFLDFYWCFVMGSSFPIFIYFGLIITAGIWLYLKYRQALLLNNLLQIQHFDKEKRA